MSIENCHIKKNINHNIVSKTLFRIFKYSKDIQNCFAKLKYGILWFTVKNTYLE